MKAIWFAAALMVPLMWGGCGAVWGPPVPTPYPTGVRSQEADELIDSMVATLEADELIDSPVATLEPVLEIQGFRCILGEYGYAYIEGEVKNISGERQENVLAVGSWYTSQGAFITSDSTLLEFTVLMPEQTSPFKVMSRTNPLMTRCRLAFTSFRGEPITTRER